MCLSFKYTRERSNNFSYVTMLMSADMYQLAHAKNSITFHVSFASQKKPDSAEAFKRLTLKMYTG